MFSRRKPFCSPCYFQQATSNNTSFLPFFCLRDISFWVGRECNESGIMTLVCCFKKGRRRQTGTEREVWHEGRDTRRSADRFSRTHLSTRESCARMMLARPAIIPLFSHPLFKRSAASFLLSFRSLKRKRKPEISGEHDD